MRVPWSLPFTSFPRGIPAIAQGFRVIAEMELVQIKKGFCLIVVNSFGDWIIVGGSTGGIPIVRFGLASRKSGHQGKCRRA